MNDTRGRKQLSEYRGRVITLWTSAREAKRRLHSMSFHSCINNLVLNLYKIYIRDARDPNHA
jgi:hypothetical protein